MPIPRRSFLAAVMGAIAAPVAGPLSPVRANSTCYQGVFGDSAVWHWTVWDSLTIMPDAIVHERLLPPPMPDEFVLTGFGPFYPAASPVDSLGRLAQQVSFVLKRGNFILVDAGLCHLPPGNTTLVQAVAFTRGDNDLGIYLHSRGERVPSADPVTVSIALQGFVRLPREQQEGAR